MALAIIINSAAIELVPGADFITATSKTSWASVQLWSDKDRAAHGIYTIVEPAEPPEWKVVTGTPLSFDGKDVIRSNTIADVPLAERKVVMSSRVDDLWAQKAYAGFSYDFGGAIGVKVLQSRQKDQPHWLALKDSCNDAIAAGLGGQPSPIQLRPQDNINITLTFNEIAAAMRALRASQASLLAKSWALKDAIAAAIDHAALDKIDITAGWPA